MLLSPSQGGNWFGACCSLAMLDVLLLLRWTSMRCAYAFATSVAASAEGGLGGERGEAQQQLPAVLLHV